MSFDIFWEKLDQQVAQNVQDLLNSHFRNTNNKPSFIGDIEISEFDFGTMPPVIEIIDMTEPFPEFYLPDDEVEEARSEADLLGNEEAEQQSDELYNRTEEEEDIVLKKDTDAQVHISFSYQGNMRMTVSTELRMNYPSMMFMSLPIRLTVTGFNFSGTGIIAYLRRRVNFCFLEPKDPNESLLKEVHIESEVGDKEKQVLKNVGKIERFIVDQLRKVIDEDFVFPSYYSVDLD
ncbi:11722_t:CDS:2 [Ambispora leptoticha]|uniref:Mitochondrial distribution and morphology protein 12 n=1 Tax=Ambispora leptoticha TaxID=144679 RepID=A0A9N8ZX35_9GLOM|nr:11722_t:CDS:2 [Ambispora leptoticha]